MMRLSTANYERFVQAKNFEVTYGGAEANVAISLAQFGLHTTHVTVLPDQELGYAAAQYLRQYGVDTSAIQYGAGRMGVYFFENGAMQRAPKIIYDRFESAFAHLDPNDTDWDQVLDGATWLHWTGITPAISSSALEWTRAALDAANHKGLVISGDINYRRNLWQYGQNPQDVMPDLISKSSIIVAGMTDFENCTGITAVDYEAACQLAQKQFPQVKYITKTEREAISASHNKLQGLLWNGKELIRSNIYDMSAMVDRIGGGDAYMAGLIYGLLHMKDEAAVEFATAASVLKHSIPGDANLVSVEEVNALVSGNNIGKLLR